MKKAVRIGLVQLHCSPDQEINLSKARRRVLALARKGADIVCLPELLLNEYFCQSRNKKFFKLAAPIPGPQTRALGELAKEAGVVLLTSVYEQTPRGRRYNTAVVLSEKGKLLGTYRKVHIPDDPRNHYDEGFYFAPGNRGFAAIKTRHATIGPLICFDQWFPEGARMAAVKGAQILFYPTAIGWPRGQRAALNKAENAAWQIMHQSHAIANNVFVVAVNRVGREHTLNFWGSSLVSDPYGRIIARAPADKETDLLVTCDLSMIETMRKDWPFLTARRVSVSL